MSEARAGPERAVVEADLTHIRGRPCARRKGRLQYRRADHRGSRARHASKARCATRETWLERECDPSTLSGIGEGRWSYVHSCADTRRVKPVREQDAGIFARKFGARLIGVPLYDVHFRRYALPLMAPLESVPAEVRAPPPPVASRRAACASRRDEARSRAPVAGAPCCLAHMTASSSGKETAGRHPPWGGYPSLPARRMLAAALEGGRASREPGASRGTGTPIFPPVGGAGGGMGYIAAAR